MKKILYTSSSAAIIAVGLGYTPDYSQALAAETSRFEEIVVSARKREETLQSVPMSVSALSSIEMESRRIDNVKDIYTRVPGIYFSLGGGASPNEDFQYISMRGVGFNGGLEPATGVFIDGMYQPQAGFDASFLDLERLEVLRGPQGTLFGRNTQAGAINMVTRRPDETFRGRIIMEVAEFATYRTQMSMSGQIENNLFAGFSVEYAQSDGFITNETLETNHDYSKQISARGTIRWTPSDALDISVIVDASHRDYNDQSLGVQISRGKDYVNISDQDAPDSKKNTGIQLNIDYDISSDITLTSITGYRKSTVDVFSDLDGKPTDQTPLVFPTSPLSPLSNEIVVAQGIWVDTRLEQEFKSEELRLAGTSDSFDWLIGAYYFEQDMVQNRVSDWGPGSGYIPLYIREFYTEGRDGWALFAQGSYHITPKLEATLGGRYSNENYEVGGQRVLALLGTIFLPVDKSGKSDGSNFSAMASIGYDINDEINIYATFAQGWKAGGLNRYPSRQNAVVPYDAEKSENFEIGIKASFADGRIRTNLAAFWIDITDQQLLNIVPDPNGLTPITTIDNAGKSRSRGIEGEISAYISDNFVFQGNIAYTDTKFVEFLKRDGAGNVFDFSGHDFENTPELTGMAALTYTIPVLNNGSLEFYAEYLYTDGYMVGDASIGGPLGSQLNVPSYDRVNANISYQVDKGWRVTLYVNNLFDTFDYVYAWSDYIPGGSIPMHVKPLEPRKFGLVIRKEF